MKTRVYEIRLKDVAAGRLFSRHYETRTARQALKRIPRGLRILWIRKVHRDSIIGTIESMKLDELVTPVPPTGDVILDDVSLSEIVFGGGSDISSNGDRKAMVKSKRRFTLDARKRAKARREG